LIGLLFYFFFGPQKPLDINALFKFARPQVVELEMIRDDALISEVKKYADLKDTDFKENAGFCSGFIIAPNVVLTASHCFRRTNIAEANTKFYVKTHDGKTFKATRVLGFDAERDYLFFEVPNIEKYGYLKLKNQYKIGQQVYTLGNVHGQGIAIREGIMASKTKDPDHPEIDYLRYSAAASPGNSGGPLLNDKGDCVGLVFAATWSENYNLATSSEYLIEGKKIFVSDEEEKEITVDTNRVMAYAYFQLLDMFAFPPASIWNERPEYPRPLEKISIKIKVPQEIKTFSKELTSKFHESFLKAYNSVMEAMKKNNENEGRWIDFLSKKTPLLITSQMLNITNQYHIYNKFPYSRVKNVFFPITRHSYKAKVKMMETEGFADFSQSMGLFSEIVTDKDSKKDKSDAIIYKDNPDNVSYMPNYYRPGLQMLFDYGSKYYKFPEKTDLDSEIIMKDFLGKEGRLVGTYHIPFVRPKSHRDFRVKDFAGKPDIFSKKDTLGREWHILSYKIVDYPLDMYCLKMPQGFLCLQISYYPMEDNVYPIKRKNFTKYKLSEFMVEPILWEIDPLINYLSKEKVYYDPVLNDVSIIKNTDGSLEIDLKTFGLKYSFTKDKAPKMLRFYGGIYGEDSKSAKWVATGFEGYWSSPKPKTCGSGLDFKDFRFSSLLKGIRDYEENIKKGKEPGKKDQGKKGPKIKIDDIKLLSGKIPAQVFGYCGNMEKRSGSKTYNMDFYKLTPFNVKYAVK